jgi:hypothetical protein
VKFLVLSFSRCDVVLQYGMGIICVYCMYSIQYSTHTMVQHSDKGHRSMVYGLRSTVYGKIFSIQLLWGQVSSAGDSGSVTL